MQQQLDCFDPTVCNYKYLSFLDNILQASYKYDRSDVTCRNSRPSFSLYPVECDYKGVKFYSTVHLVDSRHMKKDN